MQPLSMIMTSTPRRFSSMPQARPVGPAADHDDTHKLAFRLSWRLSGECLRGARRVSLPPPFGHIRDDRPPLPAHCLGDGADELACVGRAG